MKTCSICKLEKDNLDFYKRGKSGLVSACKTCTNSKNRKRYNDGKNDINSPFRNYYLSIISTSRDYIANNRDKDREKARLFRKNNRGKRNEQAARRRAKKLLATPPWSISEWDSFLVSETYHLSELRNSMTSISWHVDHVVPLISDKVCGLHCASNLEVIPAILNMIKHNNTWPNMWSQEEKNNGSN